MKPLLSPQFVLPLTLLPALGTALAQTPPSWNNATLSTATYVVLEARVEGNPSIVSQEQLNSVLAAVKRDTAGAIKRRYPAATIAEPGPTGTVPGAIVVQPTFTTPANLLPWSKMSLRYDLTLPDGTVALVNTFTVLELYQRSWDAMNYAGDRTLAQLP